MLKPTLRKPALVLAISLLTACSASRDSDTTVPAENESGSQITSPEPLILNTGNTASQTAVLTDRDSSTAVRTVDQYAATAEESRQARERNSAVKLQQAAPAVSQEIIVTGGRIASSGDMVWQPPVKNTENYNEFDDNGVHRVALDPLSTFSIDVDTGAYSNARRFLNNGQLPPADAVRTEEFINYFSYDYPRSDDADVPFSIYSELAPSPFSEGKHLVHIGIRGDDLAGDEPLNSNLVFLVDVSGSMNSPDKLELLKTSLKMLTRQLSEEDRISLVVYAGASGVVLEPTAGNETRTISAALDRLQAGGSTNGGAGISLAYALAEQHFIDGGINRVILATDGDFNVGTTNFDALIDLIEDKRQTGIGLTTLGFGTGNYNDHLMEQLADAGNGNYAYIDTLNEARKVLVDEGSSTLQTIAKDVKIQIEFNPAVVSEYRLVGYENRALANEDFNNDKVDAGEIGAGHTVTALYEISLTSSTNPSIDPLRYGSAQSAPEYSESDELAFLKLRYKAPQSDTSQLISRPLYVGDIRSSIEETSDNYRFSAAVAGMAQLLRQNSSVSGFGWDETLELANGARGSDPFGYRSEFVNLVKTAQVLAPPL